MSENFLIDVLQLVFSMKITFLLIFDYQTWTGINWHRSGTCRGIVTCLASGL